MLRDTEFIAKVLNLKKTRVYELVRRGFFPPGVVVRLGRQIRWDEDALRQWIARGGSLGK